MRSKRDVIFCKETSLVLQVQVTKCDLSSEKICATDQYLLGMVAKEDVVKALKTVNDPEIGIDIVDLGLVYDLKIDDDSVTIKMTMTAPSCPLTDWILFDAQKKVEEMDGVSKCDIELVWDPPWTPDMISDEARKMLNLDNSSH